MTKAKVQAEGAKAPKAIKGTATKNPDAPVKGGNETETVFMATLTVAQVLKYGVRLNVHPVHPDPDFPIVLAESSLNFNRLFLPPDYDLNEGREYELTIKRVK